MTDVVRQTFNYAIGTRDGISQNFAGGLKSHFSCCSDTGWCGSRSKRLESHGVDHLCMITRMRLGILEPDVRVTGYPSAFAANTSFLLWNKTQPSPTYMVNTIRTDTFWKQHLDQRRIDFLKIDIDRHWSSMGLDALIEKRGFKMMTVEVDGSWGKMIDRWNVSAVDQFVWFARSHGYVP